MSDTPRLGRPKGTGSQRIYDILRMRILSLQMAPGSGIDENDLVEEFGISRTPVREALIRLATDGFVTLLPNRGASVSPLDIDEIPELLAAMELCMRVTSRWAALRRSDADIEAMMKCQTAYKEASLKDDYLSMSEMNSQFHLVIGEAARNRHFIKMYTGLVPQYNRLSLSLLSTAKASAPFYKKYFQRVDDDHVQLVDAIRSGDADAADAIAQSHARLIGERLEAFIWSSLSDPIALPNPASYLDTSARNKKKRDAAH